VVLSCIGFLIMLNYPEWTQSLIGKTLALSLLSMLACMEKLSAVLNTISVERDWVVVVAGANEARLATMNAQMRRIDLFCKLVAPLAISLVDSYSTKVAALVTAALSIASVSIEYFAIARVYQAVPALRDPKSSDKDPQSRLPVSTKDRLLGAATVVSTYVCHPAFLPSFALALLYLTVLSFSGQLITYLLAQDLNSATVALLRGVAALFELSATWLGPWLHKRIGAVRSGIWFLNAELLFVAIACGILWLPDEHRSKIVVTLTLVAMVILSRTGLWGFDLSAQLIIQDEVESDVRGMFSSLEASCQNIFEMLAFLSTIIFPRPEQFKIPAIISASAVATAALLFAYFVRKRRGHLLHASRCLDRHQNSKPRHRSWEALPQEELQDLSVDRETRA
jgi:iron-regulated transporter 1